MNKKQDEKVKKIKIYLKLKRKFDSFLELKMYNKSPYNFFVTCGVEGKSNLLKLFWIDLDTFETFGFKCLNEETLFGDFYEKLENYLKNTKPESFQEFNSLYPDYTNMWIKTENEEFSFEFSRFIPKDRKSIIDIFLYVFDFLPVIVQKFMDELVELAYNSRSNDYLKMYCFDVLKDDIGKLFPDEIISRGNEVFHNGCVKFLERIGESYYAVVSGTEDYLVVVNTTKENWLSFSCSCPCEFGCKHVVAVINAIREKKFNRFYKLCFNDDGRDLFNRVTNKSFILCTDIVDDDFIVVNMSNKTMAKLKTSSNVSIFEDKDDYLKNKLNNH